MIDAVQILVSLGASLAGSTIGAIVGANIALSNYRRQKVKNYTRAIFAKDLYDQAVAADTVHDFRRFSKLASNIADWRSITWHNSAADSDILRRFGSELNTVLSSASERMRKRRAERLFGYKAPEIDLVKMLRS